MTDVRISRACNAARKQGYLDGLRKAAALVCRHCSKNFGRQPTKPVHKNGRWFHATGAQTPTFCKASTIHDEIAAMPKHGAPPAKPAQEYDPAKDPDMMTCPACRGDGFARGIRPGACSNCEGSGQVPVPAMLMCGPCNGTGEVQGDSGPEVCSGCNGSGAVT